jgi:NAD-dependent deacetylase
VNFPPQLITILQNARSIVVLTGAGMSAESGVPTFRDAQTGLWAQYDPTELATPQAFERNPKLVWDWYAWRRELVSGAKPNPGHFALATIEQHLLSLGDSFTLITQNVDGLHLQAGSQNIIELHGNIQRTKCYRENIVIDEWPDTPDVPPHCPRCDGYLRPDVVWFNEAMPQAEWRSASEAAWACDVLLSIGTSAIVQPAASLPYRALERGATVIEINPNDTPLTAEAQGERFYRLRGKAGEVLPALAQAIWGK